MVKIVRTISRPRPRPPTQVRDRDHKKIGLGTFITGKHARISIFIACRNVHCFHCFLFYQLVISFVVWFLKTVIKNTGIGYTHERIAADFFKPFYKFFL